MMDVDTALRTRGSSRAFLPRPVARASVEAILDEARFAPSGSNSQPWRIHVVAGAARDAVCDAVREIAVQAAGRHFWPYQYDPAVWREPSLARRRACGWGPHSLPAIGNGGRAAMRAQEHRNYEFFDAPVNCVRPERLAPGGFAHRHGLGANA